MADATALSPVAQGREGSSPSTGTNEHSHVLESKEHGDSWVNFRCECGYTVTLENGRPVYAGFPLPL